MCQFMTVWIMCVDAIPSVPSMSISFARTDSPVTELSRDLPHRKASPRPITAWYP